MTQHLESSMILNDCYTKIEIDGNAATESVFTSLLNYAVLGKSIKNIPNKLAMSLN